MIVMGTILSETTYYSLTVFNLLVFIKYLSTEDT